MTESCKITGRWRLLRKCRKNHKWFEDLQSGRIACADYSGNYPDQCDDGVIWLNRELPIVIRECSLAYVPGIKASTDEPCSIGSGLSEVIYLIREQGMEVEFQSTDGQKARLRSSLE